MNNKAGLYEFITDDYIVAGCKMDLGLTDTTSYDLFLKDAINLGTKELRNLGVQTMAVAQLPIENFRAKLPAGFIRFVKRNPIVYVNAEGRAIDGVRGEGTTVVAVTASGTDLGSDTIVIQNPVYRFSAPSFINNAFPYDSPYDNNYVLGGTVNIIDGWLVFSTNVIADYIKIGYMSALMDENGNLKIPAYCERALRAFGNTRFCMTNFERYGAILPRWEYEWKRGKADCKGYANMPNSDEYECVNRTMLSLL